MFNFQQSVGDFHTMDFQATLKQQIKFLPAGSLPLEKGLAQGGYVDDSDIEVTILSSSETVEFITAKLGVFFTEIVINCGCGDDPMSINAYCEMRMVIKKLSHEATFEII